MPDLPTLTVATKGEADVLLAWFDGEQGFTDWLASAVRDEVERRAARQAAEAQNTAVRDAVAEALDAAPTVVAAVESAAQAALVRDAAPVVDVDVS